MKQIFSIVLLLVTNLVLCQVPSSTSNGLNIDSLFNPEGFASIGHPYTEFRLTGEYKTIDNQGIKGKVVLINFWFEGCHPCMAEMEALNELFTKMKGNKDFVFISLSRDDNETIKRVKEKFNLTFEIFSANNNECKRLNYNSGYPTSIILDKTGIIRYRHCGGSINVDEAREFIMTTLLSEIQTLL